MHKLSSAVPEMKQGLISVGICCNQMKYGTVTVEKGTCQAFPAQRRGEVKEAGVSWPGRSVCVAAQPAWRGLLRSWGSVSALRGRSCGDQLALEMPFSCSS